MPNYISLSTELQERIIEDRKNHWENPFAFKDEDVVRRKPEKDRANIWRPAFVRDCEKIMHIPFYNRYSDKTQVFSLYKNDDITRRSQHVQLVSRTARNIGKILGLNIDLIEAIALGHDLGHTPFGHAGEKLLSKIYNGETGRYFNHNIQSARILDKIFNLNISLQTLDGIICHNGEKELKEYRPESYRDFENFDMKMEKCLRHEKADRELLPATLEGCVMRISDIIAYLGKDRQDAQKLGIDSNYSYKNSSIGTTNAEIINNLTVNLIENSYGQDCLRMDDEFFDALAEGKRENYEVIYENKKIMEIYDNIINPMIEEIYYKLLGDLKDNVRDSLIFTHHINYVMDYTKNYTENNYLESDPNDIVVDYIASMTDDYFIDLYKYLFPEGKYKVSYIGYFGKE